MTDEELIRAAHRATHHESLWLYDEDSPDGEISLPTSWTNIEPAEMLETDAAIDAALAAQKG